MTPEISRRPLKTREKNWPRRLAFRLVSLGLTPNQISLASVSLSGVGAGFLALAANQVGLLEAALFLVAAICIQLRLLCNLLDGLMAVEGGLKTKTGEIYNEFPDRVADILLLLAAGYSVCWDSAIAVKLGCLCAIASVLTAYVRVFGGSAGLIQDFCGPMAKQQRMAALTLSCILSAGEALLRWPHWVMPIVPGVIFLGSLFTAARRTVRISRLLNARS